jgi:GNAT-like C-terminal domain/N-acyltransferase N-terminal domain
MRPSTAAAETMPRRSSSSDGRLPLGVEAVAERLGLGADYQAWLGFLEATGAPADCLRLPSPDEAALVLRRVGVDEPDLAAILAELPSPTGQPELWWLLERCYHGVLRDIGQPRAVHSWPTVPSQLGPGGRCFWIWVYLAAIPALRSWHRQRGIDDDVSTNTIADLGRHIRLYRLRTGNVGFDEQFWFSLHFRGELFELGRLQFNPYQLATGPAGPLFWYDATAIESRGGRGFRPGDPVLGVHIPESGPLTPSACDASFQAAREFFAALLPAHTFRVATCTSWLMDDQLLEYLDEDTNIVRFQRRFDLVPGARDDDRSPLRFVFHKKLSELDQIVPRTRLEHAIVNHISAGRHWRMRTGCLRL